MSTNTRYWTLHWLRALLWPLPVVSLVRVGAQWRAVVGLKMNVAPAIRRGLRGKVQMVRGLAQPFAARQLDNSLALMTVPKCETWTPHCNNRAWLNVNKPDGKTG